MKTPKPIKTLPPDREYLVTKNIGLARKAASDFVHKRHRPDLFDEALSATMLALVRAAIGFKPELGWKFSTYAMTACVRTLWRLTEELDRGNLPSSLQVHEYDDPAQPAEEDDGPTEREISDLKDCLSVLDQREIAIVTMRYYGDETLDASAAAIGVSKERARQIQAKAIMKMQRRAGIEKVPSSRSARRLYREVTTPVLFEDAA